MFAHSMKIHCRSTMGMSYSKHLANISQQNRQNSLPSWHFTSVICTLCENLGRRRIILGTKSQSAGHGRRKNFSPSSAGYYHQPGPFKEWEEVLGRTEFWGRALHGAGEWFSPGALSVVTLEGSRQEDLGRCHVVTTGHQN